MVAILPEFASAAGLIVGGGLGARMGGVEKGLLPAGTTTIGARTVAILRALCEPVLVATPRPEAWSSLPVTTVADLLPNAGPLGGLAAGLAAAGRPWLITVAADLPLLSADLLRVLVTRALAAGRTVIPRLGGRPEPLHAIYRTDLATLARQALLSGERKMTAWLPDGAVDWVDIETLRGGALHARALLNVNTPEDLRASRGGVR